ELHDVLLSRIVVPVENPPIKIDDATIVIPPLHKGGPGGVSSHEDNETRSGGNAELNTLHAPDLQSPIPSPQSPADSLDILYPSLAADRRATTLRRPGRASLWTAAERLPAALAAFPDAIADPSLEVPAGVRRDWTAEEARVAMIRGLMEV